MSQHVAIPSTAPSHLRSNVVALALVAVVGLGMVFVAGWLLTKTYVSTSAVSPDGKLRAEIVDHSFQFIDRNFAVRIVDDKGNSRTVFRSPDESPSGVSQEKLLWSADGKQLLLVGKFWAREGAELQDGECLYLLCDVETGEAWCNSDQRVGPGFDRERLEGFDLTSAGP